VPRPLAVAITGSIGAGKSEALAAFARHGAAVVSSDEIVHRLLREDEDIRAALVERFGDSVLTRDGEIDRAAIADVVFADRAALDWLERLLHPLVAREYLEWRKQLGRLSDPPAVCATEVPLLYEVGGQDRFDAVVAIAAPARLRRERSEATIDGREGRMLSEEEKLRRADFAYVNDGSLAELDAFVAETLHELEARARP
jgi:dephospho-CoA kinase